MEKHPGRTEFVSEHRKARGHLAPKGIEPVLEAAAPVGKAIRSSGQDAERSRTDALRQLDQRRRAITSKLDRGYEDLLEGKITADDNVAAVNSASTCSRL
jgi:hypothetical protein